MSSTNGGGFKCFSPENTNWIFQEVKDVTWTVEENKRFEKALAFIDDKEDVESWSKIAALIPGKTVYDVIKRYKKLLDDVSDIEAGLVPDPRYGYDASSETTCDYFFGLENSSCGYGYDYVVGGKRSTPAMTDGFRAPIPEKERKKGVPWTEEEHRRFLMGLKKYGKGDWRNIARNFVTTRTPTQVASHAQKYFIRQLTDCKDKRRSSIHDITTVNVPEGNAPTTTTPAAATVSLTPANPFDVFLPKPHHSFAFSPASSYHNTFPQWS
ncbi:Duplicated homeodomain-like superfamily protein [Raphanus sativus]|uniref:Transcription factor DIVARICATA n=1 Tax=Raphanus sativus TaxID=3726 RepID=A0A6J0LEF7_RAPSA|nr:transcription factor DIVARICATA [Raphanus sativus]KAJ4911524.1 Duplicated homeodomain-like superfamily protein [Raphanus sativus]